MTEIPPISFTRTESEYGNPPEFQNVDAEDHYLEIHAFTDLTYSVQQSTVSVPTQAVCNLRNTPTQTPFSSSNNRDTEYEPELLNQGELQRELKEHPLTNFFESINPILYDAMISNEICDAEFALMEDTEEYDARGESTLPEIQALQHAKYTKNKVVTAETTCNYGGCTILLQAVAEPNFRDLESEFFVLIWNIADALEPLACLKSESAITSMEVSELKGFVVACGTTAGQILIYDLDNTLKDFYTFKNYNEKEKITLLESIQKNLSFEIFEPAIYSPVQHFHSSAITCVKWLPQDSQILRSGELQLSANLLGGIEFCTVSPDGFLKVFSLQAVDKDQNRSDLTVLIPFAVIPCSSMFKVTPLKPVSIIFPVQEEPTMNFAIGDAFGRLSFSNWPAAIAGAHAMSDDKSKIMKKLQREMTNEANNELDKMQTFFQDKPTRGTFITSFQYFLSAIFRLEFSRLNPQMLLAAAPDGVKLFLLEKNIHYQSQQNASRGLVEEQLLFQQDFQAAQKAGFIVVEQFPATQRKYQPQSSSQFIDLSALLQQLNLQVQSSIVQSSDMSSFAAADLAKRALNQPQIVSKAFETDFYNFDFYTPVFSYQMKEGNATAACLSQSRVSVLFIGTDKGQILVFDLLDRMHEPLIQCQITVGPVTTLQYQQQAAITGQLQLFQQKDNTNFNILPEKKRTKRADVLIVGDINGTLHVLEIPSSLRAHKRKLGSQNDEIIQHEKSRLRQAFRRCLESEFYMRGRQAVKAREIEEEQERHERRVEAEKEQQEAERIQQGERQAAK